jgi:uncharacterized protein (DUF1501 family)
VLQPRFRIDRRGFLQAGATGVVAAGLPGVLRAGTDSTLATGRAKSVLIVLLSGGPSQLDTLDLKPDAPAEVRGEFQPIATQTPGVQICEHLPGLAHRSNLLSVVRSLSHTEHNHLLATHVALTGRPTPIPRGGSDLDRVQSRNDFPNFAAALDYLRPRRDGIPTGVSLPNYLIEGPLTWPGQHAGFLGVRHDPWSVNQNPNDDNFRIDSLALQPGLNSGRLASRRSLLEQVNDCGRLTAADSSSGSFQEQQAGAFSLLTSAEIARAFEIHREDQATRERYGRNKLGQSLLLSRRLIAAGVPMVQAAMGIVQTWDTHTDNWGRLKNTLLPQVDRGLSALLDDLRQSGLLETTLVIVMGEFGRTPKISTLPGQNVPGRDHWAHVYSALFAGAGVRGGQVIGQSDEIAAYPVSRAWTPADVCSTIFNALGVDPDAEIFDPLGRPNRLQNGHVIEPLYTARTV